MIAAEMACLAPTAIGGLVLVDPFGLWLDESPIPDIFALLPYEFGEYLFHQPQRAATLLAGATDVADADSLRQFFIDNARRLGTAARTCRGHHNPRRQLGCDHTGELKAAACLLVNLKRWLLAARPDSSKRVWQ